MDASDISTKILQKSADFLGAALKDEDVSTYLDIFKSLSSADLIGLLEEEKKIFWLNVYNGLVQNKLQESVGNTVDKKMFTRKIVDFAGKSLSLDQIEHGILRGDVWKYSMGYLPGNYLSKNIKNWRCKKLDPRIHFQLNCGAQSCPMIRILTVDNFKEEMQFGESDFIQSECRWDPDSNRMEISGLFLFYWKDFGGMGGIRRLLRMYYPEETFRVRFARFNWSKMAKKTKLA